MPIKNVIIHTPYSDFGELISQCLVKNTSLNVISASTIQVLASQVYGNKAISYALLDLEMGFEKVQESAFIIRDKYPDVDIILLAKKDPPEEADMIRPWRLLKKPFIESELLSFFSEGDRKEDFSSVNHDVQSQAENLATPWIVDQENIASILLENVSKLGLEEIILLSENSVLAHTNSIQIKEIGDCSKILHAYLDNDINGEVIKQVHLASTEYLLHGTILAVGIILAILYKPETPYRIIRNQTKSLAAQIIKPRLSANGIIDLPDLLSINQEDTGLETSKMNDEEKVGDRVRRIVRPRPAIKLRRSREAVSPKKFVQRGKITENFKGGSIPPQTRKESKLVTYEINKGQLEAFYTQTPSRVVVKNPRDEKVEGENVFPARITLQDEQSLSNQETKRSSEKLVVDSRGFISTSEEHSSTILYPSHLSYSCLLIPRIKYHTLNGDLGKFIEQEVPNIFLGNGWRLEYLKVEKQSLQWTVTIPSSVAPSHHVNTIRRESSRMILAGFDRLRKNGLVTDFWAPGYFLQSGRQPMNEEDITDFIRRNRRLYYPDERVYRIPEPSHLPLNG